MGAWGELPLENDAALDWMATSIVPHLVAAIETALNAYLNDSGDEPEAEAAAALLVDCTSAKTTMKYNSLNLRLEAKKRHLWRKAVHVVDKIMASEDWIGSWKSSQIKLNALKELKAELIQVIGENKE
jgi:hypothetical protein